MTFNEWSSKYRRMRGADRNAAWEDARADLLADKERLLAACKEVLSYHAPNEGSYGGRSDYPCSVLRAAIAKSEATG